MQFLQSLVKTLFVFAGLCISLPALADPGTQWRLTQRIGEVWIATNDFQPIALAPNDLVPEKSVIVTGERGRAILARGAEQIVMHPNTRLVIPETRDKTTRLGQSRGSAVFNIERKSLPHFRVDTPFLAAVVKGTVFTVTVSEAESKVEVTEGAVAVGTNKGEALALVRPGMKAEVKATNSVVIDLTDETGRKRKVISQEADARALPTERFDWGPGGMDGNDGGPSAPGGGSGLQTIELRNSLPLAGNSTPMLLRVSQPDIAFMDLASDKPAQPLPADNREARISNLANLTKDRGSHAASTQETQTGLAANEHGKAKEDVASGPWVMPPMLQTALVGLAAVIALLALGRPMLKKVKIKN